MSFDPSSFSQDVLDWTEKHAGLGGWVGALGAVIAIFVTWGLARAEYQRTRRQEKAKRRAEIDLFKRVISAFESKVQRFKELAQDKQDKSETFRFYTEHIMNGAEWQGMRDLESLPVINWPTLEIYAEFRRYFEASNSFMLAADPINVGHANIYYYANKQMAHDKSIVNLTKLLRDARND
jgi:hypothetical protein